MIIKELKLSGTVPLNSYIVEEKVPTAGKDLMIDFFSGEGGHSPDTGVCLIWDLGGEDEELIWVVRGSSTMPAKLMIDKTRVDGAKKLSLVLDNTSQGSVHMAGYCRFSER